MQPVKHNTTGIILIALAFLMLGLAFQGQIQAANLFQSPLPPPDTPCFVQTLDGFTLEVFGYVADGDSTTTITYRVTNTNKKDISYLAFGTASWTPLAPSDGMTTTLNLGDYHVEWTNDRGNPGFAGIKYETQYNGFSKGAQDTFALTVGNFAPAASIQVQMKAGKDRTTFTLTLSNFICDRTPTPTSTATPISPLPTPTATPMLPVPDEVPNQSVFIFSKALFAVELSEAEKAARWEAGLPVPEIITIPVSSEVSGLQPAHARSGLMAPIPQQVVSGWSNLYDEDFESGDLSYTQKDDCGLFHVSTTSNAPEWGIHDYWESIPPVSGRADPRSLAIWLAASGTGAVNPGNNTYPTNFVTQMFCTFDNVQSFENFMVEFDALQDQAATAGDRDTFYIGFHTGEEDAQGVDIYYALGWQQSLFDAREQVNDHVWEKRRIFYPELAADAAENGSNQIKVVWRFFSDQLTDPTDRGAWLDNIKVEKYNQPAASMGCETHDSTIAVPGVPGNGLASKGLNLPPYAVDNQDRVGQTQRLLLSGVNWVRLEFVAQPTQFYLPNVDDPLFIPSVDMKHYDQIIDDLCANQISVLGLLSYQMVLDRSWDANNGIISNTYLEKFIDQATLLTNYFDDRIRYWEIWNEPDFADSQLLPAEYLKVLDASYDTIKANHPNDLVIFGGLGGTDDTPDAFMVDFQDALQRAGIFPAPYDIFAVHPYPSGQWRDPNRGNLPKVDPYDYMDEEYPNVLDKFLTRMRENGKANAPLWITEIGWNRAAESTRESTLSCARVNQTMVDRYQQAKYLAGAFDVLLTRVRWDVNQSAIPKVFWYQYGDTGIDLKASDCTGGDVVASTLSAAWPASYWAQTNQQEELINVDWWFGLYSGTDAKQGIDEPQPNLAQCTFAKYPNYDTVGPLEIIDLDVIEECLPVQVFLPMMMRQEAAGQ